MSRKRLAVHLEEADHEEDLRLARRGQRVPLVGLIHSLIDELISAPLVGLIHSLINQFIIN